MRISAAAAAAASAIPSDALGRSILARAPKRSSLVTLFFSCFLYSASPSLSSDGAVQQASRSVFNLVLTVGPAQAAPGAAHSAMPTQAMRIRFRIFALLF